jgi:hypothetical protein
MTKDYEEETISIIRPTREDIKSLMCGSLYPQRAHMNYFNQLDNLPLLPFDSGGCVRALYWRATKYAIAMGWTNEQGVWYN